MPEINIENDPHVFTVTVKNKGMVYVDGIELQLQYEPVEDPHDRENIRKNMAAAMRSGCSWTSNGTALESFGDEELAAVGVKVLTHLIELGKGRGPSPTSSPPTASGRVQHAG